MTRISLLPLHPWHQALSTLFAATVSYIHLYIQCRANSFSSVLLPWIKQGFLTKLFLNLANPRSLTPVPSVSQQNPNIGSAVGTNNYHLPSSNSPSIIAHMPHAPDSPNQQPVIQVYDNTLTTLTHTHTHTHIQTHTHTHTNTHTHTQPHLKVNESISAPLLTASSFSSVTLISCARIPPTLSKDAGYFVEQVQWKLTLSNPMSMCPSAYLLLVYVIVYFITRKNKTL